MQQVADALKTRLSAISDTRLSIYTEPSHLVTPPAIVIDTPDTQLPTNLCETEFTETYNLFVVVSYADMIQAHRDLRDYLSFSGTRSIRAALMADKTLGAVVHGLEVLSTVAVGPIDVEEESWFGAIVPVEVDH